MAAAPTMLAVTPTPTVASRLAGPSTERTVSPGVARPPSNRMSTSAITPTVWANVTSLKRIHARPSSPITIPMPRKSSSPGTWSRSARRVPPARPGADLPRRAGWHRPGGAGAWGGGDRAPPVSQETDAPRLGIRGGCRRIPLP